MYEYSTDMREPSCAKSEFASFDAFIASFLKQPYQSIARAEMLAALRHEGKRFSTLPPNEMSAQVDANTKRVDERLARCRASWFAKFGERILMW